MPIRKLVPFAIFSVLLLLSSPRRWRVFARASGSEQAISAPRLLEAEVVSVSEETPRQVTVAITSGERAGERVTIANSAQTSVSYKKGDKIFVHYYQDQSYFELGEPIRFRPLFWLFAIFAFLAVLVAGKWGVSSLISLAISYLAIFALVLPLVVHHINPSLSAFLGALLIAPATFYLSHGFNKKTHIALAGTGGTLAIVLVLAEIFIKLCRFTGLASEEALFLRVGLSDLNFSNLLLAGIIIGALGILDDITISQSAIVAQLKSVNPKMNPIEQYRQAMAVGKDHIASMINTLILVYTGASLPLLLLFTQSNLGALQALNFEPVSFEVVKALVGSIGLIIAVPLTTLLATLL